MPRTIVITPVLLTLAAMGACSIDDSLAPSPPSAAAQPPGVREYVDALAARDDPDRMREGLEYAVSGSIAAQYLQHQANYSQARLEAGDPLPPYSVVALGDQLHVCDMSGRSRCAELDNFHAANRKVIDLYVGGENPGPRLTVGDGEVVTDGVVTGEFLTAYRTVYDDILLVTVRITTTEAITLDLPQASYDGTLLNPAPIASYGASEMEADGTAIIALAFQNATAEGTLSLRALGLGGDHRLQVPLVL